MEDARIIEMYWQRQESAITETAAKYGAYCRAIAMQILQNGEDAEECVNDTWLRVWNRVPPERPLRLSAYLGAITRRLALDGWRRRQSDRRGSGQVALSLEELTDCIPAGRAVEEELDEKQAAALVSDFLRTRPQAERCVFLRRYWYFDSVEQIALRYGYGTSKVKMMLKRTRDRLREVLEKEGITL